MKGGKKEKERSVGDTGNWDALVGGGKEGVHKDAVHKKQKKGRWDWGRGGVSVVY